MSSVSSIKNTPARHLLVDTNPAANSGGSYDPEAIKAGILQELSDLKATVESFGVQAIKDGSWFNKFLKSCLSSYERQVMEQGGAAYLRGKYPGLPTDAVAGKLCELAETYAALAGGLSGATASGAVLTAGFGVPAAIVAVTLKVTLAPDGSVSVPEGPPAPASGPTPPPR
jgi:hypothetical protein